MDTTLPETAERLVGEILICRVRVIGTRFLGYTAWEKSSLFGPHTSLCSHEQVYYGQFGTDLPPEIASLPLGSKARLAALDARRVAVAERAYALIVEAFPEAGDAHTKRRPSGEIERVAP